MIVEARRVTVALLSAEKVEFIVVTRRRRRPDAGGAALRPPARDHRRRPVAVAGVSLAQAAATFERVEGAASPASPSRSP